MKNTSKKNIEYQYGILIADIIREATMHEDKEEMLELDCNNLIECLEGIKQLQIALTTLKN